VSLLPFTSCLLPTRLEQRTENKGKITNYKSQTPIYKQYTSTNKEITNRLQNLDLGFKIYGLR